jgi:hypothetical protein
MTVNWRRHPRPRRGAKGRAWPIALYVGIFATITLVTVALGTAARSVVPGLLGFRSGALAQASSSKVGSAINEGEIS